MKIKNQLLSQIGNIDWTHNWTLGGLEYYGEIRNDQTGEVWLCQQPITHEEFKSLPLPNGFSRVGIGRAAHDVAYFPRSPHATEESLVNIMEVDNRIFQRWLK